MNNIKYLAKIFLLVFITLVSSYLPSQNINQVKKYWIYFSDKNASPYKISEPDLFLSSKSIERRARQNISITYTDIPVNSSYIGKLKNEGIQISVISKWLNAVSAYLTDDEIAALSVLPFVKSIKPVEIYREKINEPLVPYNNFRFAETTSNIYGLAGNQFEMINGQFLHDMGLTGAGMTIAVFDGGFLGVDTNEAFSSYWQKEQILGVRNFPDNNSNVFNFSAHGTEVLSIMAADIPNTFVGAAPDANYYLFRTEIVDSEHVAEEDFWMQAAELADSLGVDVINSSLGYTEFDDSTENHTYSDMDGNTTVVTIAADLAAQKGILVCNSAGNSATDAWHYIGAPADGDSVFSIGAVDENGGYAFFSSVGPTFDGRIKPNIAVQGLNDAIIIPTGQVAVGSGTSFSSPLAAGTSACLWQAFPEKTNMEIIDAIQKSASQANNPDYLLGYGIPNYALAYLILKGMPVENSELFNIFPNPILNAGTIVIYGSISSSAQLNIYDIAGRLIINQQLTQSNNNLNTITIDGIKNISSGIYLIEINTGNSKQVKSLVIN